MKTQWLNVVLLLTNRIYQRKQRIVGQAGLGAVYNIFILIVLEIALGIISLPLYLGLRSSGVTAFFAEKGTYEKVSFDYNLRRVLTLSGVGIIAAIWAVKLALILFVPKVYGPLQLYSVSDFRPADVLSQDLVATETGMQTARVIPSLPVPKLEKIEKIQGGDYEFFGKGQAGATIILMLSGEQTAVYTAEVDKSGNWQLAHAQNSFKLSEGNHAVVIFSYDKKLGVRSNATPEQYFKVTTTWWDVLVRNVDVLANWSIVIIILLGVFLTFLTI